MLDQRLALFELHSTFLTAECIDGHGHSEMQARRRPRPLTRPGGGTQSEQTVQRLDEIVVAALDRLIILHNTSQ
jgi:hypothetical protein